VSRWLAVVRPPTEALARCALTHLERQRIDVTRAAEQHGAYVEALAAAGAEVVSLPSLAAHPDAVFVEDPALVFDELAIMTRPAPTRRGEGDSIAEVLARHRPLQRLTAPAELEGGDVLVVGRRVWVGRSSRTTSAGISALREMLTSFGYRVDALQVCGCLHLKTGCSYLGRNTYLVNGEWVDAEALAPARCIEVGERFGGNALRFGERLLMSASHPRTVARVRDAGFDVDTVDISELEKAEAGLSCMSLRFQLSKIPPSLPDASTE